MTDWSKMELNLDKFGMVPAVMLKDAAPDFVKFIEDHLPEERKASLILQLPHVIVLNQGLGRDAENFRFAALTVPLLTTEQKITLPFGEYENVILEADGIKVDILLDEWGRFYFITVTNLPELYYELKKHMSYKKTE